ncbi:MAG: T9SS type A sorting domain-containing protein [Bacteroidia bacterium]|jgi:hypothetical protein|nr:T9SS type A sorting domain-containing protein [Bacteroidia bacterium]
MFKLRVLILVLVYSITYTTLICQTTNWVWAENSTGGSLPQISGLANDQNGNAYMVGAYSNTLSFGSFSSTSNNVFSDGFMFKVDGTGAAMWSLFAGGNGSDGFTDLAVDASGDIYVAGIIGSPSMAIGGFTVTNSSFFQFFIMKMNAQGNIVWVKSSSSGSATNCKITSDNSGIYLAGVFSDNAPLVIESSTLVSSGLEDIFMMKFDIAGNLLWATKSGGPASDYANSIDLSQSGDIFISGGFNSNTLSFGTNTISGAPTSTNYCGYTAKFSNSGQNIWVKKVNPINNMVHPGALTTDASGNSYFCGTFSAPGVIIDTHTLSTTGTNYFLAKYDSNGNVLWATNEGGSEYTWSKDIAMDYNNNVYVCGNYKGSTVMVGSFPLTNDSTTQNVFLAGYNSNGQIITALQGGGKFNDEIAQLSVGPLGEIYVGGSFDNSTVFGTHTLSTLQGLSDMFLTKAASISVAVPENPNYKMLLKLYPNPVQSNLVVMVPDIKSQLYFSILNLLGQTLAEGELKQISTELDVQKLKPGFYTFTISGDGINESIKFIKE